MSPFSFSCRLFRSVGLCNGVACFGGYGRVDVRTGSEAGSRGTVRGWSEVWRWGAGGVLGLLMGLLGELWDLLVEPLIGIGSSMV